MAGWSENGVKKGFRVNGKGLGHLPLFSQLVHVRRPIDRKILLAA